MKIVIPGGTGQVGRILVRHFVAAGHDVVTLSRSGNSTGGRGAVWDGASLGAWAAEVDGADVVINLAGRTVNCRYTEENLGQMMRSRVDSARVVGQAIAAARRPPGVWLQASTATIYAHNFGPAHDEDGVLGGGEAGVPAYWRRSTDIARAWEDTLNDADTPHTRKVALRTSYAMSPDRDGIFDVLFWLARRGLGGPLSGGEQFVSWICDVDLCAAVDLLISRDELRGPVNLASPNPVPYAELMATLRQLAGVPFGLPITPWMARIGAVLLSTDVELVEKSRKVVSSRLPAAGLQFRFPTWERAARDLVGRWPIVAGAAG